MNISVLKNNVVDIGLYTCETFGLTGQTHLFVILWCDQFEKPAFCPSIINASQS